MKINSINTIQSFRGNNEQAPKKSFMGHLSDAIDSTTKAIKSTADITDGFTDLVMSTKNAIDTPEEVTIRVLNNQLENKVVNNEKAPSWVKKPATYLSAALISVLTFFATKKVINAPGAVLNWSKKMLGKNELGKSVLNLASTTKNAVYSVGDKVKSKINLSGLNPIKEKIVSKYNNVTEYLAKTFPNVTQFMKGCSDAIQLKDWTKSDYVKNAISVATAISSGKSFINKHDNVTDNIPKAKSEVVEPEVIEPEIVDDIKDAA